MFSDFISLTLRHSVSVSVLFRLQSAYANVNKYSVEFFEIIYILKFELCQDQWKPKCIDASEPTTMMEVGF